MTQNMLKKNRIETHNKNMSYARAVTLFGSEFSYDFTVEYSKNGENGTVREVCKGPKNISFGDLSDKRKTVKNQRLVGTTRCTDAIVDEWENRFRKTEVGEIQQTPPTRSSTTGTVMGLLSFRAANININVILTRKRFRHYFRKDVGTQHWTMVETSDGNPWSGVY